MDMASKLFAFTFTCTYMDPQHQKAKCSYAGLHTTLTRMTTVPQSKTCKPGARYSLAGLSHTWRVAQIFYLIRTLDKIAQVGESTSVRSSIEYNPRTRAEDAASLSMSAPVLSLSWHKWSVVLYHWYMYERKRCFLQRRKRLRGER